jgi:hypothetical protein
MLEMRIGQQNIKKTTSKREDDCQFSALPTEEKNNPCKKIKLIENKKNEIKSDTEELKDRIKKLKDQNKSKINQKPNTNNSPKKIEVISSKKGAQKI